MANPLLTNSITNSITKIMYNIDKEVVESFNDSMRFHSLIAEYKTLGYQYAEQLIYGFYTLLNYGTGVEKSLDSWQPQEHGLEDWVFMILKKFVAEDCFTIARIASNCAFYKAPSLTEIRAKQICAINFADFTLSFKSYQNGKSYSLPSLLDVPEREKESKGLLLDLADLELEQELSAKYSIPVEDTATALQNNHPLKDRDLAYLKSFLDNKAKFRADYVASEVKRLTDAAWAGGEGAGKGESIAGSDDDINADVNALRTPELKQVLDALGYMKQAKSKIKAKKSSGNYEKGLELGNEVGRVLSDEFAKKPIDFCLGYAEAKLWQTSTIETKGKKGDFFALFDSSGSMTKADCQDLTRSAWAKAFIIAATEAVIKTKGRQVHFVPFAYDVWKDCCFTVDGSDAARQRLIEFHAGAGGTNWKPPLDYAIKKMQEESRDHRKKCDVLYITDADDFKKEELQVSALKESLNFRIHVVLINRASNDRTVADLLDGFADKVIDIRTLVTAEAIAEAATGLIIDYE